MKISNLIRVSALYLIVVLWYITASAQTTRKSYHGPFTINEMFTYAYLDGTADYSYFESSDGSRIYDGKFSWSYKSKIDCKIEGQFYENHQTGEWHYWEKQVDYHDIYDKEVTLNFNKYGYLDGDFKIYTHQVVNGIEFNYNIKGKFENGIMVSCTIKRNGTRYGEKYSEEYENIRYTSNGKPTGTWTYKEESSNNTVTVIFDSNGKVSKAGYYNNETGDWVDIITYVHRDVYDKVKLQLYRLFMRSSPGMKKLKFIL